MSMVGHLYKKGKWEDLFTGYQRHHSVVISLVNLSGDNEVLFSVRVELIP